MYSKSMKYVKQINFLSIVLREEIDMRATYRLNCIKTKHFKIFMYCLLVQSVPLYGLSKLFNVERYIVNVWQKYYRSTYFVAFPHLSISIKNEKYFYGSY